MSDTFLNELTGGLVALLREDDTIRTYVGGATVNDQNARIFAEAARQGAAMPHLVFTQAGGADVVHHGGHEFCKTVILHIYSYATSPNTARALAYRVHRVMIQTGLGSDTLLSDGTKIKVCNGSIVDSGYEDAVDGSNVKKFWVRSVFRMLIEKITPAPP